jgi:beta-xylosidase
MELPNPLVPGFNPDPSVLRFGDDYYLATSSFEYLPGIPIHHSRDLVSWDLVGHVATRPGQLQMEGVPTAGGAWAPTIRSHDGLFYVAVTDAMGRGTLIFTATDPAGPWSDGLPVDGVNGIDPDLAWDGDDCYLTYSGLQIDLGRHLGIQQVRVDVVSGKALEEPRSLWSGTGLMFPEAPHLYRIGDWWYLMIAEGGTERGHAISIARSTSPAGPFDGGPHNPVLSARSTARPVQNTGHGDLVQAPDGSWAVVLLGMRTRGMTRAFSSLGRETFATGVRWVDGWPVMAPVLLTEGLRPPTFADDFDEPDLGGEWVAVRRFPGDVASVAGSRLSLRGEERTMDDGQPTFVGRRQRRLDARISTRLVDRGGVGGLTLRYDEQHHYDLEVDGSQLVARARLSTITQEQRATLRPGPVVLYAEMDEPGDGFGSQMTSDLIRLGYEDESGDRHDVATLDGRFLSAESTCSFTGRVAGLYCVRGVVAFDWYREEASGT